MAKETFIRYVMIGLLSLALAACAPTGTAQETRPAGIRTIAASETEGASPAPEASATPEHTPTVTATATPESSPTPKPIEFPTNLSEFTSFEQSPMPLYICEWGPYETKMIWAVKIRPEDRHNEKFTLQNGRYLVIGWMDAWWQEQAELESDESVKMNHLAIPYIVIDTHTKKEWWLIANIINDMSDKDELYTAMTERWEAEEMMSVDLKFTENGDFIDRDNLGLYFGAMPNQKIDSSHRDFIYIKTFIDFWQPLLADIYTEEAIEEFAQTGDASILNLETISDGYLPEDFVLPLKPEP